MRILVVEDDPRLSALLRQGLREQGLVVDVANEAKLGLELATAGDYGVLVLDVMLPGRSGFDLLRDLRAAGSRLPVLILSARSSVEDRVRGLDLGADDYLAKPFDFAELLARLRAITRRPDVEPRTVLRVADLELDPARHEVRRGGQRVELTAREFALLEYLMRKAGVVLTRDMILDQVWGIEYDGGSNLIEVYVNYLRRKLDPAHELIHTVRGLGYTLREAE